MTAKILKSTGSAIPAYTDARTRRRLNRTDEPPRRWIFGMLTEGAMAFDGRRKLAKYATGEVLLFDLKTDRLEQTNLAGDPAHVARYRQLDIELTVRSRRMRAV